MSAHSPLFSSRSSAGFSLVELMIAITIGLVLLAGLTTIFVNNNNARSEVEKANRQIENGRYAVQLLTDDLRLAGFYGPFDPNTLPTPGTKPNACATDVTSLKTALPLHVQGYDNLGDNSLTCISDRADGTDVIVVRRISTCVAGTTDCDPVETGSPYFQASLCNTELDMPDVSNSYALDTDISNLGRHQRDCTATAEVRRYRTHIYFVANNDKTGDGIRTLKRAELGAGQLNIVSLVNGIENIQLEYGEDDNGDGTPDAYTADPDSYNTCAGAACVTNWKNVVAVKINLLARNPDVTPGYTDTKQYILGLTKDGADNVVGPLNDGYKRHVYQAVVRLANPAGRRE